MMAKADDVNRLAIQEAQYDFPYHYLPHVDLHGNVDVSRRLPWGLEYLAYLKLVADAVEMRNPESILDVGCGDGRLLSLLSERLPNAELTGIDISLRAVNLARALNPGLAFDVMDVANVSRQFDVVTLVETLEHVDDDTVPTFLGAIRAAVKPAGCLLVTVPSVNLPLNRKHYRHYTPELLQSQLRDAGFSVDQVQLVCPELRIERIYRRLSHTRYWTLDSPQVRTWIWRRLIAPDSRALARTGRHVFAVARPT
jgi:SAM-dependent methyltransferase